ATVSRSEFTRDRFRRYRAPRAAAFVGVYMRVKYINEHRPTDAESDGPAQDSVVSVDYTYDLELDQRGRIIGGEWYKVAHPDFLWTPPPGARATTAADRFARGRWDLSSPLPTSWQTAAWRTSSSMQPLAKIVERLIEFS